MLHYALYPNHLTGSENNYLAIPQSPVNKRIEDVIHQITNPGSILKETECVAVIHDFFRAISTNLKEGQGFISEYIRIQPSIKGVFKGINDTFDPARHHTQINILPCNVLKDAISEAELEKVEAIARQPEIKSVYDLKSQQADAVLSPDHMIEIIGSKLKLNTGLADEGIFIINHSDDSEVKIAQVHTNLPSKLFGMLPENLATGTYRLEVRNRPDGNSNLHVGAFTNDLTVY